MRKLAFLIIAIILVGAYAVPVAAQAPASYESTVAVVNTSSTAGTISFTFYNPDGTVADDSISDPIAAFETKFYTTFPVPDGFQGSMVIQSDVPLASTSTIMGKDAADSVFNYASYVGVSSGSGKVYLPLLMKDNYGFNTYFSVQNTGSAPIDVDIAYSSGHTRTITALAPGASEFIDNQAEPHAILKFSAVLTTTGEIAVAAVEYGDGTSGRPLYAYNGFVSGDTNPVIPMVNQNNYGYWTAIPIQNLGTVETEVTLTYYPTKAGNVCTETLTIPPGGDAEFGSYAHKFDPQTPGTTCQLGEKFVGIAAVTANSANQPLIALMNQLNNAAGYDKGEVLMSIAPSTATSTIVFPEVYQWYGSYNWFTALTLTNVSGSELPAADISCRGVGSAAGNPVDVTWTNPDAIADGEGWITDLFDGFGPMPNGFSGSVICTSATGQIVGTNNTLGHGSINTMDAFILYEGINTTP
jgi:hypothetical protein